ncbi:MAG: triose-phosphate isomerase [Prevotella sp.]|nr:triose-phosphate isomerase [Prevotella sp.]
MKLCLTIITNLFRFLAGITFILSGFVKAVDPIGTQYKIADYAAAMGLEGVMPDIMTLGASVLLSGTEFVLGIMLLFAIRRRLVTKLALLFVGIMTAITVWLYVADPVSDCGCFGDAIKLTNGETLLKNIVLLAVTALLAWRPMRMPRMVSRSNQWIVYHYSVVFILVIAAYSLYYLPLFDFRPYHIGADIAKGMEVPEDAEQPEFETTFIMEKDGIRKEFGLDNYPDSTWTFIDSKTKVLKQGYIPPIHDFALMLLPQHNEEEEDGDYSEDITETVLADPGYTFLLISPHLENADDSMFGNIDQIYEYACDYGYKFYCLTASGKKAIDHWTDMTGAEYPFCNVDETTLKTIIRSNPGLVLLKGGVIVGKWSHNNLPTEQLIKGGKLTERSEILPQEDETTEKTAYILLWFVLPLALLVMADRLWMWSKWIKNKETKHSDKLFKLLKIKPKMRKKIVAGNWKMNKNLQEGVALAKELTEVVKNPNCGVIICTPFIHLASVAEIVKGSAIELGAENCADKASGAFTGEVSAEMVKSTGADYVILGHSERREYYNETPEILKEKVQLALANGLKVIFCIGETLAEREANKQNEVVKAELAGSVFNLTAEEWKNIVIAYEPIWAIGTGKTATAEQAEEIHAYIRSAVAEVYGQAVADETTILYGGSCKASNAPELFAKPDIDGGLIGGASLKAADFKGIIDAWN